MRKRPDYGDATPEDLALALLQPIGGRKNARRKKGRSEQSDPGTSAASQPDPVLCQNSALLK